MSLQRDDLNVKVPHYHAANAYAIEAEKVKINYANHDSHDICTRHEQVLVSQE